MLVRILKIYVTVTFFLLLATQQTFGLRYNFTNYSISNGLPSNHILKLMQDSKGYLWVCTMNGVVVFDGVNFKKFDNNFTLSNNPIRAIYEDKNGLIWIGTTGKGLVKYDGSSFTYFSVRDGLSSDNITSITADSKGNLFIGTDRGLSVSKGNKFVSYTTANGLPDNRIISLYCTRNDQIWVATLNGLALIKDNKTEMITKPEGFPASIIFSIDFSKDGIMWLSEFQHLLTYDGKVFKTVPLPNELEGDRINDILHDHEDNMWVATYKHGFGKYINGKFEMIDQSEGLCNNAVLCMIEDREGNIWLGTQSGLDKFTSDRFKIYGTSDGLSANNINTTYIDKNNHIWVGTVAGGLNLFNKDGVKVFSTKDGLKSTTIWSICQDNDQRLLVGTTDGVYCYDAMKGKFIQPFNWLSYQVVYSIIQNKDGTYFFGTDKGVYSLKDGIVKLYNYKKGLASEKVRSLLFDSKGTLWIGTLQGSYFLLNDSIIIFKNDIIPRAPVTCILEDMQGNIVFNTFDFGVYIYDRNNTKNIFQINSKNSPLNKSITTAIFDDKGNLWTGNYSGIDRINWKEYLKSGKINITHFDKSNGFFGGATNDIAIDTSGNLWLASVNGLIKYNAKSSDPIYTMPNVIVSQIQLFLKDVDWHKRGYQINASTGLPDNPEFRFRENHLSFIYNAIYFTAAEEIKYRFILEGFDNDWSPQTKYHVAYYSNLTPGNYVFKVQASINGIHWTQPAEYKFLVSTPWWMTIWAYIFYAAAAVLIVFAFLKMRTRNLQRSSDALSLKVEERTHELHEKNLELEKLSLVASKTDNAVLIFDKNLELEFANAGFNKMTGFSKEDFTQLRGVKIEELTYFEDIGSKLQEAINNKTSVQYESMMKRSDGHILYASSTLTPIFNNLGELQNIVVIDTDISARKIIEERLKDALDERGILLKEIHHRVKNNLQIIISLFNLQSYYVQDEGALLALKEGQRRVRSMALIHERFYQSEGLSKIDFDDYVRRLGENLFQSYSISPEKVSITIEADKVAVDIDTAVPCGLIINELLSNSLKHAFNNTSHGEIHVEFREPEPDLYRLTISDNGPGLPENFEIEKSESLGMQLISALADQIDGKYKFENKNGLTFALEFKKVQ